MPWLILIGVGAWFLFGDPVEQFTDWNWPDTAAPWEQVDAFYYPNRNDLTVHEERRDVGSVATCRFFVGQMAALANDSGIRRGDYECGVGPKETMGGGITVYRITTR